MTPGQYLRKRREAAGLGVIQAAASWAALSMAPRQANARTQAAARLNAAEDDSRPLYRDEALALAASVFRFDVDVYLQLLLLGADPDNPDLPRPAISRECACSWHDACLDRGQGCHWVEHPTREADGLCSRCLRENAVTVTPVLVSSIPVVPA